MFFFPSVFGCNKKEAIQSKTVLSIPKNEIAFGRGKTVL